MLKVDPRRLIGSLLPILGWSRSYDLSAGVGDLIAGITVALTLIPQSIAYASLAGFEPQCRDIRGDMEGSVSTYWRYEITRYPTKSRLLHRVNGNEGKNTIILRPKCLWFVGVSRNAVVVVLAAVLAYFVHEDKGDPLILTGDITPGLPTPQPPAFHSAVGNTTYTAGDMLSHLGSGMLVVPIVGIISNVAIAKAFARGKTLDATQEIIALGACNVVSAFFRSFPVNGSFTRSAVSDASGVRTPAAGFYTALSAVIVCAVLHMVDIAILKKLWATNSLDLIPLLGTFVSCLALGIEVGLICGVIIDMILILYYHSRPPLDVEYINDGILLPHYAIRPVGGLHFAGAERVRAKLNSLRNAKIPQPLETLTVIPDIEVNGVRTNGTLIGVNGTNGGENGGQTRPSLKMLVSEWSQSGRILWCNVRPLVKDQLSSVIYDPVCCDSDQLRSYLT
ncbi:Sodium-independent sulfate anion transporter, partial [Operophtera brumata]